MLAFHMTWFAFFLCFFAWFGMAPLVSVPRFVLRGPAADAVFAAQHAAAGNPDVDALGPLRANVQRWNVFRRSIREP